MAEARVVEQVSRPPLRGRSRPRVAPPTPARSDVKALEAVADELGHPFLPWQHTAARFIEALGPRGHQYREVAILVSRQNGKTELLRSLVIHRLRQGRRIMHTAQNRDLPREVFYDVAEFMWTHHRDMFPMRNDRETKPRYANGQEEIRLTNGGRYRIVAPTRSGARGESNDDVIIDELREMDTFDFIGAAKPTMTTSEDPQLIYLSNAGESDSVVLNSVQARAGEDPNLAYLEWSAAPERKPDDRRGWAEGNPALGHLPGMMETLEAEYLANKLAGTLELFEVEHLCRSVISTEPAIVTQAAWSKAQAQLEDPRRTFVGINVDRSNTRASAVAAWLQADGSVAVRLVADVTGDPISLEALGPELRGRLAELNVREIAFDPYTDGELAAYLLRTRPVRGLAYASASQSFARRVDMGTLHWDTAVEVGEDLKWLTRRASQSGWMAVKTKDDRPVTAGLAAIRAVGLALEAPEANREARIW